FRASMARSNNTLSGCLEPILASGLLTFLLVQATVTAIRPARRIIGIRRNIAPRKYRELCWALQPARLGRAKLGSLQRRPFAGCLGGFWPPFTLFAAWPPLPPSAISGRYSLDRPGRTPRCPPPEFPPLPAPRQPPCPGQYRHPLQFDN